MDHTSTEIDSIISLTWGLPPVRDPNDFWTWNYYRMEINQWVGRLPPEFLQCYGYVNDQGGPTGRWSWAEADSVLRDLRQWVLEQ